MQKTYKKPKQGAQFIIAALIFFSHSACKGFFGGQAIEDKIRSERTANHHIVHPKGQGNSFFDAEGLSPNWDAKADIVQMPEIGLQDQSGKTQTQDLFKDKVTLLGFFFTNCDGICPNLIANMKRVEKTLEAEFKGAKDLKDIQYVILSVDPDNDAPERLRKYAAAKELDLKKWTLLTGKKESIYQLARKTFNSEAFKKKDVKNDPNKNPRVIHSEHFYILDRHSRLRGIINGTRVKSPRDAQQIVAGLLSKKSS